MIFRLAVRKPSAENLSAVEAGVNFYKKNPTLPNPSREDVEALYPSPYPDAKVNLTFVRNYCDSFGTTLNWLKPRVLLVIFYGRISPPDIICVLD